MNWVCGCGEHAHKIENGELRVYERSEKKVCERARPFVREKRDLVKRTGKLILEITSLRERANDILVEYLGDDERFDKIYALGENKTDSGIEYIREKMCDEDDKKMIVIGRIGMAKEAEIIKNNMRLEKIEENLERICFEESVLQSLKN